LYDLSNRAISNDLEPRFQGHEVAIDASTYGVCVCVQLTRDLFAIAKFLVMITLTYIDKLE